MAINIDSFLEKYHNESKDVNIDKKSEEKLNLNFQKDIEDKILNAENKIKTDSRFELLEKIYDEVKKFDEDIPSKFIGIENKASLALKEIGDKYSEEFLIKIKENVSIIHQNINEHINILDIKLKSEDFASIIKEHEITIKLLEIYPKEFLKEKLTLSREIKKREIIIYKKINDYKIIKLKNIKSEINQAILNLNKSLFPENLIQIEGKILILQTLQRNIPKIFLSELNNEKMIITKALYDAEKYMENAYILEFKNREDILHKLFENFHNSYIKKDLSKAVILYDEILLEFQSLPDVFFEKKMELYKKINELYSMINDLFLKSNLNLLMQSYNVSQIFKEATDYIKHIKLTSKLNLDTLSIIREKILHLPEKCEPEKTNILKEIDLIKTKYSNSSNKIIEPVPETTIESESENRLFTDLINKTYSEIKDSNVKLHKESNFTKQILDEINLHYEKIKKSKNPIELKILYDKIIFYLNTIQIEPSKKKEIIAKINKVIVQKNLS